MKREMDTIEQILSRLRKAGVPPWEGVPLGKVCRQLEIIDAMDHRWRMYSGGCRVDQAIWHGELDQEGGRLTPVVRGSFTSHGKESPAPV